MARRRKLTSPLALAVLATLADRPMHPYEIAQLLKFRGKDQSIKIRYGSLYTVVQGLESAGFVAADGTARAGRRPERTYYRITDEGRTELVERLAELVSEPAQEFPVFGSALSLLMILPPDHAAELLGRRLEVLDAELARARAELDELVNVLRLPRLFLIEGDYALTLKQAEADWVRGLLRQLADGTFEDLAHWRGWHETGTIPAEWGEREWAKADQALLSESEGEEPG